MGDDEKFDLDDDDLDLGDDSGDLDGGDDFAGELDDMIGDDELGDDDDSDGGDSELDSFFEDLSSIEEVDSGHDEPSPSPVAQAAPAPVHEPVYAEAVQPAAPAPASGKKGGKLKYFVIFFILLLIGGGAGYWYYFMYPESMMMEEVLEEEPLFPEEKDMPLQVEQEKIPEIAPPMREPEPPPAPIIPKKRYLIQIAQCSFEQCKEDFTKAIQAAGEPVFRRKDGEKFDFIEVRSRKVFSYRDANKYVEKINNNNKMAGIASLISLSNGYRITMGTFPALDRAKIIKAHIEKLFPNGEVVFHLNHVRKSYETTKIFAGPYNSREIANNKLRELSLDRQFRGSFLVRYPK